MKNIKKQKKPENEYKIDMKDNNDVDTSDEEELRNSVGNIPHEWYDRYSHIGYSLEGNKILKPESLSKIETFLKSQDDPNFLKTIYDKSSGNSYVLNDDEIKLLQLIQEGSYPSVTHDPFEPYNDWFTKDVQELPLHSGPERKSNFMPSKYERIKVLKLVRAIKEGRITFNKEKKDTQKSLYLLWNNQGETEQLSNVQKWKVHQHLQAPKTKLPGTELSYRPPIEYLPDEEELKKFQEMDDETKMTFILSQNYDSLRHVPAFEHFVREKYDRCLDLLLCPRKRRMKVLVDPEDLIPKLPSINDLQPFPSWRASEFSVHKGKIRSISINPNGEWIASLDNLGFLYIWEIITNVILASYRMYEEKQSNANCLWNPNSNLNFLLVSMGQQVDIIVPRDIFTTYQLLDTQQIIEQSNKDTSSICSWTPFLEKDQLISSTIKYNSSVSQVIKIEWHPQGDYFFALVKLTSNRYNVIMHQISRTMSQMPFSKNRSYISDVKFHPFKPIIFISTKNKVISYNLQKQELLNTYLSGFDQNTSLCIHPLGDNFILGSFDSKVCWFDMELSTKPYKILNYSKNAINHVEFHSKLPLCAISSEDGSITILHSKVYDDLSKNPLIIPIKQLRTSTNKGIVLSKFHPLYHWLITASKDGKITLFM